MYSNTYYDNNEGIIHLWEKTPASNETKYSKHSYHPVLFERITKEGLKNGIEPDAKDIYGYPLTKLEFKTERDCKQYALNNFNTTVGYNYPTQAFLLDRYYSICHEPKMANFKLNMLYWDIETYSINGVPGQHEYADTPIFSIAFYNNVTDKYMTFIVDASVDMEDGHKKIEKNNKIYEICKTEKILLHLAVQYIRSSHPDLLVGFNSLAFDFPLFMERCDKVLGREQLVDISPIKIINRYVKPDGTITWKIAGISQADYMELIKKYSYGDYSSYSLDNLSHELLKRPKLPSIYPHQCMDDKGNVTDKEKWYNLIQYNIRDVECIVDFESELQYIELSKMIWLKGLSEPQQIYGTIAYIDGAISSEIRRLGMIQPNKVINEPPSPEKYPGGWVKDPVQGILHWVVCVDANSLYPNSIIALNISPETKTLCLRKEQETENVVNCMKGLEYENKTIEIIINQQLKKISVKALSEFIKSEHLILSPNGIAYKSKEGIIPRIMTTWYKERKEAQKHLEEAKDDKNDHLIRWYDTLQYAIKIMLNSTYGATGSKYSSYFDIDNAKAVTYAGRKVTQYATKVINQYFNEKHGITDNCVLYCDTDSAYVHFEPWLKKNNIQDDIVSEIGKESDRMAEYLNDSYEQFCIDQFNSRNNRYVFKKETIADNILFLEKKNYAMHLVESDGRPVDKLKAKGIEIVRSSTPVGVKSFLIDITLTILSGNSAQVIKELREMRSKFMKMNPYDIARASSVKNIEKYIMEPDANGNPVWKTGTPVHVKASICYNHLTRNQRIKYNEIKSNTKMKYVYLKPNVHNWNVLGFIDEDFPSEFGLEIDYDKQFDATVMGYIRRVFTILGWAIPNIKIYDIADYFV